MTEIAMISLGLGTLFGWMVARGTSRIVRPNVAAFIPEGNGLDMVITSMINATIVAMVTSLILGSTTYLLVSLLVLVCVAVADGFNVVVLRRKDEDAPSKAPAAKTTKTLCPLCGSEHFICQPMVNTGYWCLNCEKPTIPTKFNV